MRFGAAAAPRWWGVDRQRLPGYLEHLAASGATSVELVVHHGPATRDPSAVHLDRRDWSLALDEAERLGLHVDVHNSVDSRFAFDRWVEDRVGLREDLTPVLDVLAEITRRQRHPPAFVVHGADRCPDPRTVTSEVLVWLTAELAARGADTLVCVELRAATGPADERFDRDRDRLVSFVEAQANRSVGLCWDVANDWLTAHRSGRGLVVPETVPAWTRHVHLHDATSGGLLHAPLGEGSVPWAAALTLLDAVRWDMSVTLEIRYRLAHDLGDPWTVLGESFRRALSVRM